MVFGDGVDFITIVTKFSVESVSRYVGNGVGRKLKREYGKVDENKACSRGTGRSETDKLLNLINERHENQVQIKVSKNLISNFNVARIGSYSVSRVDSSRELRIVGELLEVMGFKL